jgi:carboxymethylenebutenolidase
MCDEHTQEDANEFLERKGDLTRRQFGALSVGTGLAMLLPQVAGAVEVTEGDVTIKTPDGMADCYFVHPTTGAAPAVLVWPDIMGLRPAFRQMGKRLAESGYSVLVVNPFYRTRKAPVVAPGDNFGNPAVREVLIPLAGTLNATTHVTDAKAFVAWLDAQPSVDKRRKIGTTGYCMGGPIVMRTAAAVPDRIGAAGSFHGGGLATDKPDSPHLLVPQMKAQFLIAVAENDDMREPEVKNILRETFAKAKLPAEIEVYKAQHGWCPPDSQVYDKELSEKAWSRMLALFDKALA